MTGLVYLNESYKTEHLSKVTFFDGDVGLECEETILYPQGGGQPTDTGRIEGTKCSMIVEMVSYDRVTGQVKHKGKLEPVEGTFVPGEEVKQIVDWDRRYLHMKLHSGGHLIDHAVQELGCPFKSLKAYHYPAGPNVEFQVMDMVAFPTDKASIETFKGQLQAKCDEILARNPRILILYDEGHGADSAEVWDAQREKLEKTKQEKATSGIRLTLFEGCPAAVPCGGTHVAQASEIGPVLIKKIQAKEGVLRISYRLAAG